MDHEAGFRMLIEHTGEVYDIARDGQVTQAKGTHGETRTKQPCINVLKGTDVQAGDVLTGTASQKTYNVTSVENHVFAGVVVGVKAVYEVA